MASNTPEDKLALPKTGAAAEEIAQLEQAAIKKQAEIKKEAEEAAPAATTAPVATWTVTEQAEEGAATAVEEETVEAVYGKGRSGDHAPYRGTGRSGPVLTCKADHRGCRRRVGRSAPWLLLWSAERGPQAGG